MSRWKRFQAEWRRGIRDYKKFTDQKADCINSGIAKALQMRPEDKEQLFACNKHSAICRDIVCRRDRESAYSQIVMKRITEAEARHNQKILNDLRQMKGA